VLGRHRELIPRLLGGLGQGRAVRALTILARAALTRPTALPLIRQALAADPGHLLVPAITVAAATSPGLAPLIMHVTAGGTLPPETLIAMTGAIPYPTVALAALNAAVTRQILDTLPRPLPSRPRRLPDYPGRDPGCARAHCRGREGPEGRCCELKTP
jgi:hypothetical protein